MPRKGGKKKLKKLMHMSSYHTTATGMDILPRTMNTKINTFSDISPFFLLTLPYTSFPQLF